MERRVLRVVGRVDVRAPRLDEGDADVEVAPEGREVEGRPPEAVDGVDVGLAVHEEVDDAEAWAARR